MVSRRIKRDASSVNPSYWSLYLKPRESAIIQFISKDIEDGSDLFICYVHRFPKVDETGKRRFSMYICPRLSISGIHGNDLSWIG